MRKTFLAAALLLPLPFAALPLFSLLFTGGGGTADPDDQLVAIQADAPSGLPDTVQASLAYGRNEPSHLDCDQTANSIGES